MPIKTLYNLLLPYNLPNEFAWLDTLTGALTDDDDWRDVNVYIIWVTRGTKISSCQNYNVQQKMLFCVILSDFLFFSHMFFF